MLRRTLWFVIAAGAPTPGAQEFTRAESPITAKNPLGCAAISAAVLSTIQAEDPAALMAQATKAHDAKEYAKCVELNDAAIKAGEVGSTAPYNAACCCALDGKTDDAFAWLGRALDAGWRDVEHVKADPDLTSLRADKRWVAVVARTEAAAARFAKSLKEPALRDELLKRMKEDQRIRLAANPDHEEWMRIDADNTAYMKTVLDKHGWPGKSMVGEDGALSAFLLVQHADADPAFQKKCLEMIILAVENKEASASHMAYLTDRVLVADGKPQRYGTQFHSVDGKLQPRPTEDPANLDARRKSVGLPPMAEYVKQMQSMYGSGE
jgi:hypothetical protein